MILKLEKTPTDSSYFWLPVYLYNEPDIVRIIVSITELIFYFFAFYINSVCLKVYLKIQLFHYNFIILSIPMFGLWYEAIIGKMIVMLYNLKILKVIDHEIYFFALYTADTEKMLVVKSINGLEMLILSGFIQWHYIFSMLFGILAICIERIFASMLIE